MKKRLLSWVLKGFCLSLPAMVLCLAAAEWTVRKQYPEYGIPVREHRLLTEFDPVLGWRKIPNLRGTHEQDEYKVVERFNSRGLRGPEYTYEKAEDVFRILILGDSFAEGYTVEFHELVSEVLQRELNASMQQTIEVINAGTGGYSTDQELLFFQGEGSRYHPDLTILMFYPNDLPMNVRSDYKWKGRGEKPMFELKDGKLVLTHHPKAPPGKIPEPKKKVDAEGEKHRFRVLEPDTWYLLRLARHTLKAYRQPGATGDELPLLEVSQDMEPSPAKPTGGQHPYDASGNKLKEWKMTEALMRKLHEECAAAGSRLLLSYVPERGEVYDRKGKIKEQPSRTEANLAALAGILDIELVKSVDLFRQKARETSGDGTRLYWKKDVHWTPEGHHLAGRILARFLEDHGKAYGICE